MTLLFFSDFCFFYSRSIVAYVMRSLDASCCSHQLALCQDPRLGYKTANGIAKMYFTGFLDRRLTITLRVRPLRRLRSLQAPLRRVR